MTNQSLGQEGEGLAVRHLEAKGYRIIERNFKNKIGEIDIVAKDKETLCFIEVKTRQSLSCGMPYESVHYYKQRKMSKLAQSYLIYKYKTCDILARFDIVSIYKDPAGQSTLEHLVNAFDLIP